MRRDFRARIEKPVERSLAGRHACIVQDEAVRPARGPSARHDWARRQNGRRAGCRVSSLVADGCIVSGASISRSLLFTGARVNSYSTVHELVILPRAYIGRNARLTRAIVCGEATIPDGLVVGEDPELDARRFRRTANGVTLVTQPMLDRLAS